MLMLGQIGAAVEFNPGRVPLPPIAHDQMPYAWEIVLPRKFLCGSESGIARSDFRIVPKEFENGERPLFRKEAALTQQPCAVGIFKAIDGVTENGSVAQIQNWIFVIAFARGRAIREQF